MHGFLVQQAITALGDHYRVDHQVWQVERFDRSGHGLDDLRRRQHAGLDGIAADVAGHRFDLGGDEVIGHQVDAADAEGVLGGQGGDCRRSIDTVCRKCL